MSTTNRTRLLALAEELDERAVNASRSASLAWWALNGPRCSADGIPLPHNHRRKGLARAVTEGRATWRAYTRAANAVRDLAEE